jgi:orotidine-5'-phosphate decarboxylase
MTAGRVIVALDTAAVDTAVALAGRLKGVVGAVKLGLEFFVANGPAGVRVVQAAGLPVFLDLKLHDIPNTVAGAVRAAVGLGPAMITVHAGGGAAMLGAAVDAARDAAAAGCGPRPLMLGVTVLTSLDDGDLAAVGQQPPVLDQVRRLAALGRQCGLDGVVCSPWEIAVLRADCGRDFRLVVPGVRPDGTGPGDQKRVMRPADALAAGADDLVIGRPITEAPDPLEAARRIGAEIVAAGDGAMARRGLG